MVAEALRGGPARDMSENCPRGGAESAAPEPVEQGVGLVVAGLLDQRFGEAGHQLASPGIQGLIAVLTGFVAIPALGEDQ